jgi:pyrroloquinoline quinone biosynthesis protein B
MVEVLLLGAAQDGGFPQAGCYCANCAAARQGALPPQTVVSLALIDRANQRSWLIDATPDLPAQLHRLHEFAPTCPLAGIFLTHAHIGHYTGLIHLGREVMNSQQLPVYATPVLCAYLQQHGPWSQLVRIGNIALHPLLLDEPVSVSASCTIQPVAVPHRNEYSDTVAYLIRGAHKRLFYCPDIDRWEAWGYDLRTFLDDVDLALVDGCFFSAD